MIRKRKTAVALSMILCLSASVPAMAEEWKQDSGGWWYEKSDGAYPREAWEKIAGTWYYFDGDGYMHSGWLQQGEDWYYMEDSGAMLHDVVRTIDGKDYAFGSDGRMVADAGQGASVSKEQMEQWFYATYAIIANEIEWNREYFQSQPGRWQNEAKHRMEVAWGITDKKTAQESIDWLMGSGHRSRYQMDMSLYQYFGYTDMSQNVLEATFKDNRVAYDMIRAYQTYGAGAIDAWDYCRAMQVLREVYLAGYYTEKEMLDGMLECAKVIQGRFASWDEMADSYARGAEYWSGSQAEHGSRMNTYKRLKENTAHYQTDWNLPLQKSW